MRRLAASSLCVLLAAGCYVRTEAAENPVKYRVDVTAKQFGSQIMVTTEVFEVAADGTAKSRSCPRLLFNDGKKANIAVGDVSPAGQQSGFRIEITKAIGKPEVQAMFTVLDKDVIVWAEAKTVKVEMAPSGFAGPTSCPTATRPEGGEIPARRLKIEFKFRQPAGQGDWQQPTARMAAIAPVPLDPRELSAPRGIVLESRPSEAACELTPFGKDGEASIKGLKGWLLPADPADFEAGIIRASEDEFRSRGRASYPVAKGKVFAIRYEDPDRGGAGEALIRIASIEISHDLGLEP